MLYPGEAEAVKQVLRLGKKYGYGNLIAHMKRAWALSLMEHQRRFGVQAISYETALKATEVDAYPQDFNVIEGE